MKISSCGTWFYFACLSFIYGTFLWCYISFLIISTVRGILFRFDQNVKYLVTLQRYGSGSCGEVLPILVWSLGFSDKVSFEGGIRDSSKEATDPEPDSLCEPESEHDSDFDTESESESEASSEWSPQSASSVGAEACCKDATQGRISAEGSGCIEFWLCEGVTLYSVKGMLESFWVGVRTVQFSPSMCRVEFCTRSTTPPFPRHPSGYFHGKKFSLTISGSPPAGKILTCLFPFLMDLLNLCLPFNADTTSPKLDFSTAWSLMNSGKRIVTKIGSLPFVRAPTFAEIKKNF